MISIHEKINEPKIIIETEKFNKGFLKLIKIENSSWYWLTEYCSRIPKHYMLPKTHKRGFPIGPIISGIGSAPNKLA